MNRFLLEFFTVILMEFEYGGKRNVDAQFNLLILKLLLLFLIDPIEIGKIVPVFSFLPCSFGTILHV